MSMGQAEAKRITDEKGNYIRTERKIQKPLNAFIEGALRAILKRSDITIKDVDLSMGSNDLQVVDDLSEKELFRYCNVWDYGYYVIEMTDGDGKKHTVAEMDWYESDNHTSDDQKRIFAIYDLMQTRQLELQKEKAKKAEFERAKQDLNAEDKKMADYLYQQAGKSK